MGRYFTLSELCHSSVAIAEGMDNRPTPAAKVNILTLINNCLDPIRECWGKPITVNSGFRSPMLNRKVGGVANSQHMKGEAADLTTGTREGNMQLFELIQTCGVDFDQLIDESDYAWVHISYRAQGNRKQVLHL